MYVTIVCPVPYASTSSEVSCLRPTIQAKKRYASWIYVDIRLLVETLPLPLNYENDIRLPNMYKTVIARETSPKVFLEPSLKGPKHDQVEGEFFYIKQTRMVR